jgi:REP element-mobilizing transposase RayT
MPRRRRFLVEGGLYHVYNRFASGEDVFSDPEEAVEFVELLRAVKKRDGWSVFAWCLMSNHYHLALRARTIPLSQGMHFLQGRFSQKFNRRRGRTGALWQSRYQARLINEQSYLDRVILYIHLNPVEAGLVTDPVQHAFSGHREIVKRTSNPLTDIDDALLCFGETEQEARRRYFSAIRAGCRKGSAKEEHEQGLARPWLIRDRELDPDLKGPYMDQLGRSTGIERPQISASEFVEQCAAVLEIDRWQLASRSRLPEIVEARRLMATLGRERWNQKTSELATALNKSADVISYLKREGVKRRMEDEAFASRLEILDKKLFARLT